MSEMATHYENVIKKQVGQTRSDVWDRLYPLNCFIGKFSRSRLANDGHTVQKLLAKLAQAEVKFIIIAFSFRLASAQNEPAAWRFLSTGRSSFQAGKAAGRIVRRLE